MFKGRLGLDTGRIPQGDRHGVVWLGRCRVCVREGAVCIKSKDPKTEEEEEYILSHQMLSCLVLEPGASITHDALRILARHGTGVVVAGEGGTRLYAASMPLGPDSSARARRHAGFWADPEKRVRVALRMFENRFGEQFPEDDLDVLRGLEGHRMRQAYAALAEQIGIKWSGRHWDRQEPANTDEPNQALNYVSVAVIAAAQVAVAVSGAIPQLGFIHEASGIAFPLDIADLFRTKLTIPVAFQAAKSTGKGTLERRARRMIRDEMRCQHTIATMIDRIKDYLDDSDNSA